MRRILLLRVQLVNLSPRLVHRARIIALHLWRGALLDIGDTVLVYLLHCHLVDACCQAFLEVLTVGKVADFAVFIAVVGFLALRLGYSALLVLVVGLLLGR